MELYHGGHSGFQAHEGLCLVDDIEVAARYAGQNGVVVRVVVPSSLVVEDCEGYDHDSNEAPADDESFRADAADRGVDVLKYEDEDEQGRQHDCWRLVSASAVAAICDAAIVDHSDYI